MPSERLGGGHWLEKAALRRSSYATRLRNGWGLSYFRASNVALSQTMDQGAADPHHPESAL